MTNRIASWTLADLQAIVDDCGLSDRKIPFQERYAHALQVPEIRNVLDISVPQITDLSEVLSVQKGGKVLAIRMDLMSGVDNHKKVVVAGLILRGALRRKYINSVNTFIDGGNFNSAQAVKFYAERFGIEGMYVMSYLFPEIVFRKLRTEHFRIIIAPHKYDHAREREFYEYLFELMKDRHFSEGKLCLWHAKYGGEVMYPLGIEIAEQFKEPPDYTISCIGAGSTLIGVQYAIEDYFSAHCIKSIVAEHELSPLMAKLRPILKAVDLEILRDASIHNDYTHVKGLPHIAIGPHYDELNPLLSQSVINRVDSVMMYTDKEWKAMQSFLEKQGMSVGNSSAANLCVATKLANTGHSVVTIIFEPFRDFYRKQ